MTGGRGWHQPASNAQAVDPVERRIFVAFRQRRIVENRIHEVVDGALERNDRLANVHQLDGAIPNDMDAK